MCPFNNLTRCTKGSEKMTISVNPDEIVLSAQQSDLGLHCLLHLFVSNFTYSR